MSLDLQPCCERCWVKREGSRVPVRVCGPRRVCAFCGESTAGGILVRAHPLSVPYPAAR